MKTALVSGAIANKPFNGGAAWTRLNYILGLRKLGFDVYFVEQIDRASCADASGRPATFENSANLLFFRTIVEQFGLSGKAALICGDAEQIEGMPFRSISEVAENAAFLLNISGHLKLASLK